MSEQQQTPPGWYPRPSAPGSLGYWDGEHWTEHLAPVAPVQPHTSPGVNVWVVVAGILVAALAIWLVYAVVTADDGLQDVTNGRSSSLGWIGLAST